MENANITYSYDIYYLNVAPSENGLKNVVKSVNWRYQIREDSHYADEYLLTELGSADPTKFVHYNNLDEQTVFSWLESAVDIPQLQQTLRDRLEENKNPELVEKPIPWQREETYTGQEEYLLVFDDDVDKVWGPMRWNSERANRGLKHYGVEDYEFPVDITMYQKELLPIDEPKVVTNRVKLYRVEYTEQPEFDQLTQYNDGITWVLDTGKAVGTYFVHDRPIGDIQDQLIEQVVAKAQQLATENPVEFSVDGTVYQISSAAETRAQLAMVPESADGAVFVTVNHEYVSLSKSQLDQARLLAHQHHQSVLEWQSQKVAEIRSAHTIEQLQAVEI